MNKIHQQQDLNDRALQNMAQCWWIEFFLLPPSILCHFSLTCPIHSKEEVFFVEKKAEEIKVTWISDIQKWIFSKKKTFLAAVGEKFLSCQLALLKFPTPNDSEWMPHSFVGVRPNYTSNAGCFSPSLFFLLWRSLFFHSLRNRVVHCAAEREMGKKRKEYEAIWNQIIEERKEWRNGIAKAMVWAYIVEGFFEFFVFI